MRSALPFSLPRRHVGVLGWALFACACFLPAWTCREVFAAEAQVRLKTSVCRPSVWRKLGPTGVNRLCRILSVDPRTDRRRAAGLRLAEYEDPIAFKARIRAIFDPDLRVANVGAVALGIWMDSHSDLPADDAVSDEAIIVLLRDHLTETPLFVFWNHNGAKNPERCSRIVTRVLSKTSDVELADRIARWASYAYFGDSDYEGFAAALVAGQENRNPQVRAICAEWHARLEETYRGDRRSK